MILQLAINACVNLVLFVLLPVGGYVAVQKWRNGRTLRQSLTAAGFTIGPVRYLGYATALGAVVAAASWAWIPREVFLREGSPQAPFLGLGIGGEAIVMAVLYGVVQTGFTEEVLFRGLIGGAAMRRFGLWPGNLLQSAIFLAPHLLLLFLMPDSLGMMPIIFAGALVSGWLLHESGSFVGPWIIHAAANVTTCLVAASYS
jgi:membrane protease YdiL (CAAX protease family)